MKKFVMFAPWKTASQTTRTRLQAYNQSPYSEFFYFSPYLNRVVHQHITCAEFNSFPESKLSYFTASFVRNPYDRVYSGFQQLQRDINNQPYRTLPEPWIRDLVMKQLADNFTQLCQSGFEFNAWWAMVSDDQIFEVGRNSNFPLHPANYWTHIAGKQFINFIGRVENFEADFRMFLDKVGIDESPRINQNVSDLEAGASKNPFGYRYVDRMNS